jgi:hypothetical protein
MILNCREGYWDSHDFATERRRVFVDGVEIHRVWYVDTDQGIVKTYDVLEEGMNGPPAHLVFELQKSGRLDPAWEQTDGDHPIAFKVIRGQVELRPFEGPK